MPIKRENDDDQHIPKNYSDFNSICHSLMDTCRLVCHTSEAYFVQARNLGGGAYQCMYKTNPGNRGWRNFT
jgi:hypothetical protein